MLGALVTIVRAVLTGADWATSVVGMWFGLVYGTVAFDIMHQLGVGHEIAVSTALLVGTTGFFERQHVERSAARAKRNAERGLSQAEALLDHVLGRLMEEGSLVVHHHVHHHYESAGVGAAERAAEAEVSNGKEGGGDEDAGGRAGSA